MSSNASAFETTASAPLAPEVISLADSPPIAVVAVPRDKWETLQRRNEKLERIAKTADVLHTAIFDSGMVVTQSVLLDIQRLGDALSDLDKEAGGHARMPQR